jgi:putative ABC transport system permease protein
MGQAQGRDAAWDLFDLYERRLGRASPGSHVVSAIRYWLDVASIVIRPHLWNGRSLHPAHPMLATHFRLAARRVRREPVFSGLNAIGLGVGMACVILIFVFVRHERSYDTGHPAYDRLYRVTLEYMEEDTHWAAIGPPVGPELLATFPEVEQMTRFYALTGASIFRVGDRQFSEVNGGLADSTFFDVFGYRLLHGNPETVLREPWTLVISASMAMKYFGRTDVVGETIEVVGEGNSPVAGVFADPDVPTHLDVDFLYPFVSRFGPDSPQAQSRTWAGMLTYVRLGEEASVASVRERFPAFLDTFFAGLVPGNASDAARMHLQPVASIHLHSDLEKEYRANGSIAVVYTFSIVAFFILLIAAVNFVNLSVARASSRVRDTAIRKTFGARRLQVAGQLMAEALIQAALGAGVAAAAIVLALPVFTSLTGLEASWHLLMDPSIATLLIASALGVGLIAGWWPAMLISSFTPIDGLRGRSGPRRRAMVIRKGLVVFQFAASVFLVAGAIVVWQQLTYALNADLGYDEDSTLLIDLMENGGQFVREQPDALRNALLTIPSVRAVSLTSNAPGSRYSMEEFHLERQGPDNGHYMRVSWTADHDIVDALGLELIEGRGFSRTEPTDTTAWVINETAARRFGLAPGDRIGSVVVWGSRYAGPVVGVVRDFNISSFRQDVEPLVIPLRPEGGGNLLVRFAGSDARTAVADVRDVFDRLLPGELFDYTFLDDRVAALYGQEARMRAVISWFSGLAIFVACLGLFGLAAYAVNRRTPEIGIRKALGAGLADIVRLVSAEFAVLLGVAFALAAPAAWWVLARWLDGFAYRIEMTVWPILMAGMVATVFALLTVGVHAWRATRIDPVTAITRE